MLRKIVFKVIILGYYHLVMLDLAKCVDLN